MNSNTSQFGRWKIWITQCIFTAQRYSLPPLGATQLHELLYLANTLAIFYNVEPVRGRVLKRGSLPFYPDIQGVIDRMSFSGVLKINKVVYGEKDSLAAYYELDILGREIIENLNKNTEIKKISRLFEELISACSQRLLHSDMSIGNYDANYSDNAVLEGQVVDFSEWSTDNYNKVVADYMLSKISSLNPNYQRDGVRLYCDYLEEALIN